MPTYDKTATLPTGLLIGDHRVSETTGGTLPHVNPATGRVQQEFPVAGAKEIDEAVSAATEALRDWLRFTAAARTAALQKLAGLLRKRAGDFGVIASRESGLPAMMSSYLSPAAAEWFDYYAGWVDKITGETIPVAGSFDYTSPEPVGVVAVILTWNASSAAFAAVAPALAAGCTVVLKPAELAPFSASLFGELCLEAGIPAGVVNVVPGGAKAGDALVRHPGVAKISFTGGPETAKRIQAAAAESLTPLLLELGGKSANIVFADADVEVAAGVVTQGIAMLNGQACIAPTRLLVEAPIYKDVVDAVVTQLSALPVGDPFDPGTVMGPVISEGALDRILGFVEGARADGSGSLLAGGHRIDATGGGYFVAPTVFGDVDNRSRLAQQEIFGPVLSVTPFSDDAEAVALANDTRYGLSAYVQTRDLARAHRVASELDVGTVWVNGPGNPVPAAPFGGCKASGYGKQGGRAGISEFLRIKNVNIVIP